MKTEQIRAKAKSPQTRQQREKRVKIIAVLVMGAFSASMLGGLSYLQNRAAYGAYATQDHSQLDLAALAAQRQANIGRAKELRALWKTWAVAHQTDLKAMLHASADQRNTQLKVWQEIPSGFEGGKWVPTPITEEALKSGPGAPWSWNPSVKFSSDPTFSSHMKWADEAGRKRSEKGMAFYTYKKLPDDFAQQRDIEISRASGLGPSSICLWASGRVTDEKTIPNPHPGSGKPSFAPQSEQVEPPFDFLQ